MIDEIEIDIQIIYPVSFTALNTKKAKPNSSRYTNNMTSGRGRFKYHDNGLTVYKLGDLVEQYLTCDEYFWWQVLRVSKKTFRCKVFYHTKEEEKVKIWKTFRTLERVESMFSFLFP